MNKGPSGIGFVECALSPAPADGAPSGNAAPHSHATRREIVVNGTRVKTVDVHAHCAVPDALAVLGQVQTFRAVRGVPLSKILDGVDRIVSVRESMGRTTPRLRVNMVVLNNNYNEIADMIRLADKHAIPGAKINHDLV